MQQTHNPLTQGIISTDLEDKHQSAAHQAKLNAWLSIGLLTDPGGREENQDCCGYTQAHDGAWVFCLADGLGGHAGGRIASQQAVAGVLQAAQDADFHAQQDNACLQLIAQAQKAILTRKHEQPQWQAMRSTLVVVIIKDALATWAHVGDVRLYHLRQGSIKYQTRDQSVPQMLVDMGKITPEAIRGHPDRDRILQALGKPDDRLRPAVTATPVQLATDDRILLASDGFWEWLPEDRLQQVFAQKQTLLASLNRLADALRATASQQEPDYDNYSALAIQIGQVSRNQAFWHKTRLMR